MATLFTDFLTALGVRHTEDYSDKRFFSMPFQSMYGLSKLLGEYGVEATGVRCADKGAITQLDTPFLADTSDGFAIVTSIRGGNVTYLTQGKTETVTLDEFKGAWNGIALLAIPTSGAIEPGYEKHHFVEAADKLKGWALWILGAALLVYLMIESGLWRSVTGWLISAVDIIGIYVSFMLVQKVLNIKNAKADAVCSVLQEGGCDKIAKSEASSFLGIVKWSEVGLAYFTVSLLALLLFPLETMPWLALCNACALPYTVWSITYQKFVAKTWCTMCVIVQACLWALFFCYLLGGWWKGVWPLDSYLFALIAAYGVALIGLNRFDNALGKLLHPNNNLINRDDDGNASDPVSSK